jgi:hypothetical protein
MDVSVETIRKNFQSKSDTELLELASAGAEMSSEARHLLLQELQSRLAKAQQASETVQLAHGWYSVVTPKTGVRFPESCPRCARLADSPSIRFESPERRRFRFFYWKTTRAVSNVPHCFECAAELKRSRTICSWTWGFVGMLWIAIAIWFQMPRFVIYVGLFTVSAPFVYLYDRTSAVKLGDFSKESIEYRFRSHGYAKAFAMLNNVQTENAETLQAELEEAISRIDG